MYTARDVMCSNVITVSVDATVGEAMQLLLDNDISGAPVIDQEGELVGIVSELQLLEAVYTPEIKRHRLRNFVTKNVLSVAEDTILSDVTNILVLHRIRRVPVLRDGRLVGIVSRRDLLRYAMQAEVPAAANLEQVKATAGA